MDCVKNDKIAPRTIFILVFVALILGGCASGPASLEEQAATDFQVRTTRTSDDAGPYTIHRLTVYHDQSDTVEIGVIVRQDDRKRFALSVLYTGEQWRNLEGDIRVQVDGQLWELTDTSPTRTGGYKEAVQERLTVELSADEFYLLTHADSVELQYYPDLIIQLSGRAKRALSRFYEEYGAE